MTGENKAQQRPEAPESKCENGQSEVVRATIARVECRFFTPCACPWRESFCRSHAHAVRSDVRVASGPLRLVNLKPGCGARIGTPTNRGTVLSAETTKAENLFVSEKLAEVADLLAGQGADRFRVRAFREAAEFIADLPESIRGIFEARGADGLEALPTIGTSIAGAIAELLDTGDLGMIQRLRGEVDPEKVLQTVPMIGPQLARKIHEELGVETLEALEVAAYDGTLGNLNGIGLRRLRGIRHSLAELLSRRRFWSARGKSPAPAIDVILDVDSEYRRRDREGNLPKIAPRRFNPGGEAWLSILHTKRGPWRLTALFSNTPNAHRLDRTRDWVVVYFEKDGTTEGQCTVVTETRGPFKGRRAVRGREPDRKENSHQAKEVAP